MARTLALAGLIAVVVAAGWIRLEEPRSGLGELAFVAALGIVPALFRGRVRIAAAASAAFVAGSIAFDVPLRHLFPFDGHDFVSAVVGRTWDGFLEFSDVTVPFDPAAQPRMHGAILMAVFGFTLLGSLAVAARRSGLALVALLAGAGWPATMFPGSGELARGTLILITGLALLAALRTDRFRLGTQALAGGAVVVLALALSASGAVAKSQFIDWQSWDFYDEADTPVGVSYVWRANYGGIKFPNKRTRVFRVQASARPSYWRSTTLDYFVADHWGEELVRDFVPSPPGSRADLSGDPVLPEAARDSRKWTGAVIKIDALRDPHLVGVSVPIAYDTDFDDVAYTSDGVGLLTRNLQPGDEYAAWGYAPRPKPAELERSPADYPDRIAREGQYLTIEGIDAPTFGDPGRDEWAESLFATDFRLQRYEPLYRQAVAQAGRAKNPYAATVALEAWFRASGGFTYDETPPPSREAPLAFFVSESKAGYCQHFAGAMALMLRFLGIPTRVAAGFTSGTYNRDRLEWSVNDRNAHTWVEVWFKGHGWLSFDPTPGRGNLSGPYSASSFSFDAPGARAVLAASALAADTLLRFQLRRGASSSGGFTPRDIRGAGQRDENGSGIGATEVLVFTLLGAVLLLLLGKAGRRRSRHLTRDPRRAAAACRRDLVDYLADQRIRIPPSATLGELRALVAEHTGVDPRRLVESMGEARFGPVEKASRAARRARSELRAVRKRLRRSFSSGSRLRGALSLRSLLSQ